MSRCNFHSPACCFQITKYSEAFSFIEVPSKKSLQENMMLPLEAMYRQLPASLSHGVLSKSKGL
jgi:hypothetical protein